jgi:hypothetical protein
MVCIGITSVGIMENTFLNEFGQLFHVSRLGARGVQKDFYAK